MRSYIVQCQDCSVQCSVDRATLYSVRIAVCNVVTNSDAPESRRSSLVNETVLVSLYSVLRM